MNDFEWRRQLRALRQPQMPRRDLWPAIDAALHGTAGQQAPVALPRPGVRRRWLLGAALAASLVLAGGVGWQVLHAPASAPQASEASVWKPADPRLAGAAIELDAARMELELALQQAPDSPTLQRLLHRTERQQAQLHQRAERAS